MLSPFLFGPTTADGQPSRPICAPRPPRVLAPPARNGHPHPASVLAPRRPPGSTSGGDAPPLCSSPPRAYLGIGCQPLARTSSPTHSPSKIPPCDPREPALDRRCYRALALSVPRAPHTSTYVAISPPPQPHPSKPKRSLIKSVRTRTPFISRTCRAASRQATPVAASPRTASFTIHSARREPPPKPRILIASAPSRQPVPNRSPLHVREKNPSSRTRAAPRHAASAPRTPWTARFDGSWPSVGSTTTVTCHARLLPLRISAARARVTPEAWNQPKAAQPLGCTTS